MSGKPKLFIGSSVEGLNIAYAAQQNLQHSAEVTVWDQGVFNLSITPVESLVKILDKCDFGMFVFSPDDILTIRGETNNSVRDNVLLEIGLFIGRLGRERCFILLPDKNNELRIPTDLIGMAPATYETDRSDGSFQAATGPACYSIKEHIKKAGFLKPFDDEGQGTSQKIDRNEISDRNNIDVEIKKDDKVLTKTWIEFYLDKDYSKCIELIDEDSSKQISDEKKISLYGWKGRSLMKINYDNGVIYLTDLIKKYPTFFEGYYHLAYEYIENTEYENCIKVCDDALSKNIKPSSFIYLKIRALKEMGMKDLIPQILEECLTKYKEDLDLIETVVNYYIEEKKYDLARTILENVLKKNSSNVSLLFLYAKLLYNYFSKNEALIPFNKILEIDDKHIDSLGYLGNIYVELELNSLAMKKYKLADNITEGKRAWIKGNIGNLYRNVGLYYDSISYLKAAIELNSESDYAHDRLASAIKDRESETEKLSKIIDEAKITIASYQKERVINDGIKPSSS